MSDHLPTVIVVCGPTAVGKTAFAIQLAQHFNTSIISADSRQCYCELNIGVAKPSPAELATVPHYFINSHSIHDEVNVGLFEQYALSSAQELFAKHPVVIMVGGTGLYIKAFCEGIDEIPPTAPHLRDELNALYRQHGLAWLQAEVQQKDPAFWRVAEQQNPHRLLRALEVLQSSGRSITSYRSGNPVPRAFRSVMVGLELSRAELINRINGRVDQMMEDGLLDEVQQLLPYLHLPALQTVGYRELFEYFNVASDLPHSVERIKINTRQYAKRQMTWFKNDCNIHWFSPLEIKVQQVEALLGR